MLVLNIRKETDDDIEAIHRVVAEAFLQAPHSDHTEHFIVKALRKAGALSVSLVAEEEGQIVGHVALSLVSISDGTTGWYGLGPIAVLPNKQGAGIGSALIHAALKELRCIHAKGCVLLGQPSFYSRFGFKPDANLVLPDVPAEYFMSLHFHQKTPKGVVSYHSSFLATS